MDNFASNIGTCAVCLSDIGEAGSRDHGGSFYCFPCLKDRMDMVIDSPSGYPCTLGGEDLDPSMIPAVIVGDAKENDKYNSRFDIKMLEYSTPAELRLFCNCDEGMFIGVLTRDTTAPETTYPGCGSCYSRFCMRCASEIDETSDESITQHMRCKQAEVTRRVAETEEEMAGLTRGVDWQMCPGCKTRIQRAVGCNHMTCQTCHAHFCYVCGCRAHGSSDHWKQGGSVGDKCIFIGVDQEGAAKGAEKRAAAELE